MIVYWAGGEDIDFTLVGVTAGDAAGGRFDTTWSRAAVTVQAANWSTWPLANSVSNPASFGNRSSLWLHCMAGGSSATTTANYIFFALTDSGGVPRILIRGTGTSGQLKISSRNAAGTMVDFAGAVTASGVFTAAQQRMDVFVNYSTSGQVQLYLGGVLAADTGAGVDVTTDSATSLSYFYLGGIQGATLYSYSQVIVADTDTRSCNLWTLNSGTAGNAQTWAGTATNVNKAVSSDATFITAASAGLIEEFKTGGITLPTGPYNVVTVKMSSRALGGSAGAPTRLEYVTRVGSTDYVGGTWTPPVGSFANDTQNYLQATNPGTGLSWSTADLTAATFNYGIESVA